MKKNYSNKYSYLMKLLDDDETFVNMFYLIPFSLLQIYVPKDYLVKRTDYLIKKGKLIIR